jgi:prepilin-type N-terminal cleavage/methylation domain-containing protein
LVNQKGVTLLELLVAISIAAIIVGVISAAIYSSMTGFNHLTEKQSVQEQARLVTEQVAATVRKKAFSTIQVKDSNMLEFKNSATDYTSFTFEDNKITMTTQDNTNQQVIELARDVTAMPFSVTKPGKEYEITVNLVFDGKDIEPYTYKSTLYTKNWSE